MSGFKLFREKGVLVFNTLTPTERFWVSIQAAAQGGGSMYAEIPAEDFDLVWDGSKNVKDFYALFNRSYYRNREEKKSDKFGLAQAISTHVRNLGSNPDPVKSIFDKS